MHVDQVMTALTARRTQDIERLKRLVACPGVSADGFPVEALVQSAHGVAELLKDYGLEKVEILHHGDAPPYVVGEWCHAPGAPTVLIYAHHDVQPPGEERNWLSPPWTPEERAGRLYGRGVADDKAGIMVHVAAVGAWLAAAGTLPVNVKFIIEGEEEVGSPGLADFLARHRERLAADCLVLTDTCNLDSGIPSLTVRLRGLIMVDVTVAALEGPLHSGIWGGPVPDPVQALAKLIARMTGDNGQVTIPGIGLNTPPDTALAHLPYDAERLREQGGLLPEVPLLTQGGAATYWASWHAPSLAVSAIDAVPIARSSNQIVPSVTARIGLRIGAEQDPDTCLAALLAFLKKDPPFGCRVEVKQIAASGGWVTQPGGPFFAAAERALQAGYGHPATHIGCGGSIPFVEPFVRSMGDIPALLLGVEDPPCRAHGENESLNLADFDKACRAAVHLYAELAPLKTFSLTSGEPRT